MSSPRLGVMRDSMLTNPLHIKASLGRSVSRGFSVPGPDFTFGMSNDSTDGGVAEVLSSWLVQRRSDSAPSQPLPPDFLSLNRDAVRSGIVTSKELSQYRAQMGGAYSQGHAPTPQKGGASRRPAVPDITFGVTTNRASDPLSVLLSHQYGQRWLDEQIHNSRNQTSKQQQKRFKAGCIPDRRSRELTVSPLRHTLPPLTQVAPALNTFRDPEARQRALRSLQARRGVQGPL
ncbi:cilia- and flagella-associated protein 77 isoform X1 [Trematomus bernacchii]|uniref:cilia- and flagella-associated protein 77 isoform X1 n=1 Tax=Trematomus bernacchii TaxID=40690 RepID=UPI00146E64DE|nr:cilia- and flagella-associated protein 77 isoform X1 [Trematomus bernacchii]